MDGESTDPVGLDWKVSRAQMLAAGCTKLIINSFFFPLDTIKARMQFQNGSHQKAYKNGFNVFTCVIKEEGFLALYRGLFIRLLSGNQILEEQ